VYRLCAVVLALSKNCAKSLLREYLITFFSQFASAKYIPQFNKFMVQLTWGGRTDPTAIYTHKEGMGKILKNIFETSYCRR
jgi:hypothetical protein